MRILSLRFKNLNSLVGEWNIDFTHPDYESHGIFAITGPTGAGKSTLLDAMGLALYGQTPRLGRITKSDNEIMSRHTGECFAELHFETAKGQFSVHWSQHRARRSASGELQQPKHELSRLSDGVILANQLNRVLKQVEDLTGMDFERFTRSMLLAQGGFAAFLQAKADERAPILEQMTGTAIYSQISVLCHERFSAERKQLTVLQDQVAHLALLDEQAEEQLRQQKSQLQATHQAWQSQLVEKNAHWQQIERWTQLQAEQVRLQEQQQHLQNEQLAFIPKAMQLAQALTAKKLAVPYAQLIEQRKTTQQLDRTWQAENSRQPILHEQVQTQHQAWLECKQQHQEFYQQLQNNRPLYEQVRALDTALQAQADSLTQQQAGLTQRQQQYADKQHQITQLQLQDKEQQQLLSQWQSYLQQHAQDAALVQDLPLLHSAVMPLEKLQSQLQASQHRWQQAKQRDTELQPKQETLVSALAAYQATGANLRAQLRQLQQNTTALLRNQTPQQWYATQIQLTTQKAQWLEAHGVHQQQIALAEQQNSRALANQQLQQEQVHQQQLLKQRSEQLEVVAQTVLQLQISLDLERRIQALSHERDRLIQGEPCPLCGATAHPYAVAESSSPSDTERQLQQSQAQQQELQQHIQQHERALIRLQADLAANARHHEQDQIQIARLMANWQVLFKELEPVLDSNPDDQAVFLQRLAQTIDEDLQQCAEILQAYQQAESLMHDLNGQIQQNAEQEQTTERLVQEAASKLELLGVELGSLVQEQQRLHQELDELEHSINQRLVPYSVLLSKQQTLATLLPDLEQRASVWLQTQQQRQQAEQNSRDLQQRIALERQQLNQLEQWVQEALAQVEQSQLTLQDLQAQRVALFGDLDPQKEEQRLQAQLRDTETVLQTAAQRHQQQLTQYEQSNERLLLWQSQLEQQRELLNEQEKAFTVALHHWQFNDEMQYVSACLDEVSYDVLMTEQQTLEQKQLTLETQLAHNKQQQELLAPALLTASETAVLQQQIQTLQEQMDEQQQQIGRITEQLETNQRKKAQQQQQLVLIEQQQAEVNKWAHLHALIGSADGKKFRNFAQGLTFDIMVQHANQQLQKMSDRYLLLRDKEQPLELQILDNYQAGEIRSTKNLSGGEGFIVSLALALGLSQMASQHIRIDSLFLDEGFGTLDEEALDTALDTLSSLQHEGKLIGLISHVSSLKERISTQIQVSPTTGGRSTLTGPGCSAI